MTTKICPNCGKNFETTNFKKKFCDKLCREVYESKIKFKDDPEAVVCKECGLMGNDITRHITMVHKIDLNDYCTKHNCKRSELVSKSAHASRSSAQKKLIAEGRSHCFTSENNPSKGEDCKNGRNSPYSKNFRGYDGLTDEEKEVRINSLLDKKIDTTNKLCNNPKRIEYYITRGMNMSEAREALSKSQATFSKEKCIEKFGPEEGLFVWKERQKKWQATLDSKSQEEKNRINNLKLKGVMFKNSYSMISQELFWKLYNKISNKFNMIYFATFNQTIRDYDDTVNNEFVFTRNNGLHYLIDFLVKDNNKIIEFDGDYWHSEKRGNQERDRIRDEELSDSGYSVMHVRERDYYNDPEKVIEECLQFLES